MDSILPRHRPFTRLEALAAGVTDAQLRSRLYQRVYRGVYVLSSVALTWWVRLLAALLVLPRDAVVTHMTALRMYGFEIGHELPLHVSTRTSTHARLEHVTCHQRRARIATRTVHGVPVSSPNRTIIDIATKVSLVELVQAAEHFIHRGLTTVESIAEYAMTRHLDGVQRTRRVVGLMREGVESPRETLLRLMIVFARLPEPGCNVDIVDDLGTFIARGDLVFVQLRVVVEYDGWHHERSATQRQRDIDRREALEAAGWRVIVVTSRDLDTPRATVRRVHRALVAHGYQGPEPRFSTTWETWFGADAEADLKMSA